MTLAGLKSCWVSSGTVRLWKALELAAKRGAKPVVKKCSLGEGDKVDSQLTQITIELARVSETSGDTRHDQGDQFIEILVRGTVNLKCLLTNVVQGFVIQAVGGISIVNELVEGKNSIVRLSNGVGNLGGRQH